MSILFAKNKTNTLALIGDKKEEAKWYSVPSNCVEFLEKISFGEQVEFKSETKDNKLYLVYIKPISKGTKSEVSSTTAFKCVSCGVSLKDGKYPTCYTCSMEIKKQEEASPEDKAKRESIKRQAIGHMTSRSLTSLQGYVDINNVEDVIRKLYKLYQELVG